LDRERPGDLPEHDAPIDNPGEFQLEQDDIKVVYHSSTGIPEQLYHFDDYNGLEAAYSINPVSSSQDRTWEKPWHPFRTKLDFEIAEVMLDAHMNEAQTERMLSLITEAVLDPESFTLANTKDLSAIWDVARETKTDMVRVS